MTGILFVLPGMLALLTLSAVYVIWQDTGLVTALFAGITPAMPAIVAQAILTVAAFAALVLFAVSVPVAGGRGVDWKVAGRRVSHPSEIRPATAQRTGAGVGLWGRAQWVRVRTETLWEPVLVT
ncbi:hypothetical protein [Sphaerisporangium aureirubrum]|uniref:Uncharacterized protein n=1 Tax=Sphaerisporangium aureirubrum TaxID=1544736 RepID=A0ABW1NLL1_9ACTN